MKAKLLGFAVAVLSVATIGLVQLEAEAVDTTRDCDKYAIVYCGTMTETEARNKYNNGDNAAIFRNFGISRAEITGMKSGVVYRDGTVRVDGKIVARDAVTAIRHFSGGNIPGSSTAKRVSVSRMADAQTALVKFDQNGRFLFAIMKPCGNPVTATPTKPPLHPSASCKALTIDKLGRTSFRLNGAATVSDGAKVKAYVFAITKGSQHVATKTVTTAALKASTTYQATAAGDYTVTLTVKTTVGDKTAPACKKSFTVTPPKPHLPAVMIEKTVEHEKYQRVGVDVAYEYEIAVTNTGDVDLHNLTVTDTPEDGITLVSAEKGSIEDNTWSYVIPELTPDQTRTFTLMAKVPVYQAGMLPNTVCVDADEVSGAPDDCDTANVDVPKPEAKTPPAPAELPHTGPADVLMRLTGALSLTGALAYYIASRRG